MREVGKKYKEKIWKNFHHKRMHCCWNFVVFFPFYFYSVFFRALLCVISWAAVRTIKRYKISNNFHSFNENEEEWRTSCHVNSSQNMRFNRESWKMMHKITISQWEILIRSAKLKEIMWTESESSEITPVTCVFGWSDWCNRMIFFDGIAYWAYTLCN